MSKSLFESLLKTTYRKGIGFGFNYKHPRLPVSVKRPCLFLKDLNTIVYNPKEVALQDKGPIFHEIELGFIVSRSGKNIPKENAMEFVGGYFLLNDLTSQRVIEGMKIGESWCIHKNADNFFPLGEFIPKEIIKDPHNLTLELKINGEIRQNGSTRDMVFRIPELISFASSYMTLNEGDLFLTGTPPGPGPLKNGDYLEGKLIQDGKCISELNFAVKLY